jgi:serine O-acetyltransferase
MIIEDLKHKAHLYYGNRSYNAILKTMRTDGTSAIIFHRMSQFLIRNRLGVIAILIRYLNHWLNACWIGRNANFGPGFAIMHPYGIVINSSVIAGENLVLQSGVVIGVAKDGEPLNVPVIGDNVYIGAGAKLFGKITIGNNASIGANAVVVKDVPDNAIVVGIPAKQIKTSNVKS